MMPTSGDIAAENSPRDELIGWTLGIVAAAATAAFLLFFREAAQAAQRNSVVLCMLLWAAIFNSFLTLLRWKYTPPFGKRWALSAAILAFFTATGNLSLAYALPILGAGMTSTLMQLQIFVVALLARVFLREAIEPAVLIGAILAIAGFALFALPPKPPDKKCICSACS